MPPASENTHHAAATSQAQQPHSQNASCWPAATLHTAIAADPVHRSELTNRPPVAVVRARVVKTLRLRSKLSPSLSPPHSSFLYNCSMGAITSTLYSEIPSTLLRSKSVVLARWSYAVSTIVAGTITPYQLNTTAWNWGAKTSFFWAGGCLISVTFTWFCVREPKGRTTAEMDFLFERKISACHFSKTPVSLTEAICEE